MSLFDGHDRQKVDGTNLFDEDAYGDAVVELLERQQRGEVIRNPGGWLRVVARRNAWRAKRARRVEQEAMGLYKQGERTDLYGKPERVILHGAAYRAHVRSLDNAAARRRRARAREAA